LGLAKQVEHEGLAHKLGEQILTRSARATEDETARRMFLLQYVQPGLAGLMEARCRRWHPYSLQPCDPSHMGDVPCRHGGCVGAGISMASRRPPPTTVRSPAAAHRGCAARSARDDHIGGVGHTLPYLIHDFWWRPFLPSCGRGELVAISYIRYRFMDTPFLSAAFQVVLGGTWCFWPASSSAVRRGKIGQTPVSESVDNRRSDPIIPLMG